MTETKNLANYEMTKPLTDYDIYDKCSIYQMYFKTSRKSYIGQARNYTSGKTPHGPKGRFNTHIYEAMHSAKDHCCVLNNAIRKYGKDDIELIVLESNVPSEKINQYEIDYIKKYNTLVPNGYNVKAGGAAGKLSDEHKLEKKKTKTTYYHTRKTEEDMNLPPFITYNRRNEKIIGYRVIFPDPNNIKNIVKTFIINKSIDGDNLEKAFDRAKECLEKLKKEHKFDDSDKKHIIQMVKSDRKILVKQNADGTYNIRKMVPETKKEITDITKIKNPDNVKPKDNNKPKEDIAQNIKEQLKCVEPEPTNELPKYIKKMLRENHTIGYKISYPIPDKKRIVKSFVSKSLKKSLEQALTCLAELEKTYKSDNKNNVASPINIEKDTKSSSDKKQIDCEQKSDNISDANEKEDKESDTQSENEDVNEAKDIHKKEIIPVTDREKFVEKCLAKDVKYSDVYQLTDIIYNKASKLIKKLPPNTFPLFHKTNIIGYRLNGVLDHTGNPYPQKDFTELSSNVKNLAALKRYIQELEKKNKDAVYIEPIIPGLSNTGEYNNIVKRSADNKLPKYVAYVVLNNKKIGYAINNFNLNGSLLKKKFCDTKITMEEKFNKTIAYLKELYKEKEKSVNKQKK